MELGLKTQDLNGALARTGKRQRVLGAAAKRDGHGRGGQHEHPQNRELGAPAWQSGQQLRDGERVRSQAVGGGGLGQEFERGQDDLGLGQGAGISVVGRAPDRGGLQVGQDFFAGDGAALRVANVEAPLVLDRDPGIDPSPAKKSWPT